MSDGLIRGYQLDGAGGARAIGLDEAGAPQEGAGPVWLHLDYTQPECRAWIQQRSGVSELVADALLAEDTRPRVLVLDGGFLLALRGVNLNPGADPEDMVSIRLWIEPRRIISTRQRRLVSAQEVAESLEAGSGPVDVGHFLVELLERMTAHIGQVAELAEDRMDELEEAQLVTESADVRAEITALRRHVIGLRRHTSPQREALTRLYTDKATGLSEDERLAIREIGDRLVRHIEDLDTVRERAALAQEELASHLSEQSNRRMYALSIIACVFLPLSFLTGLLGINVAGIPWAQSPYAFWGFVAILLALVGVELWLFRKLRWL